jgi:hypothetical protein
MLLDFAGVADWVLQRINGLLMPTLAHRFNEANLLTEVCSIEL